MKKIFLSLGFLLTASSALGFELIAHRGVHQNYHRKDLKNDTCTAVRIDQPSHEFLENTLPSIRRAFDLGATMVEIDIHRTTEAQGQEPQLVVFHDWTLDCRTEARCETGCNCESGECVTQRQSLAYLKTLDLGYGYTADGGKTFPFRGKFQGQMPTLDEVLNLLSDYPTKKLTLNLKDGNRLTSEIFLRLVAKYPVEVRRRIYFEYYGFDVKRFQELEIQEAVYQGGGPAKACFKRYFLYGWTRAFPQECRNTKLFVPLHENLGRFGSMLNGVRAIDIIWGWPNKFIERANRHGTRIFVSQVDSEDDFKVVRDLPVDGYMTNKIEVIAPLMAR
jgi:glycerophosphoryl diester phosphodiesterase